LSANRILLNEPEYLVLLQCKHCLQFFCLCPECLCKQFGRGERPSRVFCSDSCRDKERLKIIRLARRRHARSINGRKKQAERQRRYRERQSLNRSPISRQEVGSEPKLQRNSTDMSGSGSSPGKTCVTVSDYSANGKEPVGCLVLEESRSRNFVTDHSYREPIAANSEEARPEAHLGFEDGVNPSIQRANFPINQAHSCQACGCSAVFLKPFLVWKRRRRKRRRQPRKELH